MPANSNSRRFSILIAAAIAIGLSAWILSGIGTDVSDTPEREPNAEERRIEVRVRPSTAKRTTRTITVSARTEPDRAIELKAETAGRVVEIAAERGATVTAGQSIATLDIRDRRSLMAEAEALIRQRELEFEAAQRLRGQEFMSPADLAAREAQLVAARATRDRIALDIERTGITAPFDAIVYDRLVEIGDYVAIGDPIAQLVDSDPLIVVGNINERNIGSLRVDSKGTALLLDGTEIEGRIRYLSPVADESTRSFRLELEIPNTDYALRAGTSAELILGAEEIEAHAVSASLLWLADDGTIGVKIVDATDHVQFIPVQIVSTPIDRSGQTSDTTLITGLPASVRLITVGQGFVVDGQAVIPQEAASAPTQAQDERAY